MKGSNSSLKCNFAYSMMFQIFTMITPFVTAPYVSRVLGPDGIGIQSYTDQYNLFLLFAAFGNCKLWKREISQARDNKEHIARSFMKLS